MKFRKNGTRIASVLALAASTWLACLNPAAIAAQSPGVNGESQPGDSVRYSDGTQDSSKISISDAFYETRERWLTYSGSPLIPQFKLFYRGEELSEGSDYTAEFTDNIEPGTMRVVITGKGRFDGEIIQEHTIGKKYPVVAFRVNGNTLLDEQTRTIQIQEGSTLSGSFQVEGDLDYFVNEFPLEGISGNRASVTKDGTIQGLKTGPAAFMIETEEDEHYHPGYFQFNVSVYKPGAIDLKDCKIVAASCENNKPDANGLYTAQIKVYGPDGQEFTEGKDFTSQRMGAVLKGYNFRTVFGMGEKLKGSADKLYSYLIKPYPFQSRSMTMKAGTDETLNWTQGDLKNCQPTYSSTDPSVAIVNNGKLQALKAGKADIIVVFPEQEEYLQTMIHLQVTVTEEAKKPDPNPGQKPAPKPDPKPDPDQGTKPAEVKKVKMHRLYNPNSGEHFYTNADKEKDFLVKAGWKDEGEGWKAPETSKTPVYRLYNANAGDHHYTFNKGERDFLIKAGWKDEGIGWYSDDQKSVPLYRQYNPNAKAGSHNYTTNKAEHDFLISNGWNNEGIAWYGLK